MSYECNTTYNSSEENNGKNEESANPPQVYSDLNKKDQVTHLDSRYEVSNAEEEEKCGPSSDITYKKDDVPPEEEEKCGPSSDITYKIDDVPPWYLCSFLGLQHYLTMVGATVSIPFLLCPALCMRSDDPSRGYVLSTLLFVSGIVTLLQTTIGCRLPIVQGGTFTFLGPTIAILSLPGFACPEGYSTDEFKANHTAEYMTEMWQVRMREVQGAICVASLFQVIIGYTGLLGLVLKYITPLTIAPSVSMIGLSLFHSASANASGHWGISLGTIGTMTLFSQYLRDVPLPCLSYSAGKWRRTPFYFFQLFPVLLTIGLMWGLCAILTVTGALPEGSAARVDNNIGIIKEADWFRFPYPFQWGLPTVSVAGVFGMLAGVLASAIESVGDYYACARLSGAPPPPTHAVNRGIGTEGLGCILAGMWGSGNGTTSYSENIGAIGITKVGSRRVIQYGAVIMIVVGLISKVGAVFLTIPTPVVGGIFCVMFGIITAVGLSNLQFVDLNSTRNLFVIGFSLFFALVVPIWIKENDDAISTGDQTGDQILKVLLSTEMFVAMILGFVLDNTIPGTPEERGLLAWQAQHVNKGSAGDTSLSCYDFPIGMNWLRRQRWARYIPCLPTYEEVSISLPCRRTDHKA